MTIITGGAAKRNLARVLSQFQGGTIKALFLRGFAWTTLGFAGSQALRLISNLALTRLLDPEHFGLMAIVTVLLIGLAMFSDIGLGPSVVRSQKTKDERFLNTAWTMQIIRGAVLAAACALLAIPAASFLWRATTSMAAASGGAASTHHFNRTDSGLYSAERNGNRALDWHRFYGPDLRYCSDAVRCTLLSIRLDTSPRCRSSGTSENHCAVVYASGASTSR